ncbi:MAG: hypothetical protein ACUVX1_14440 [Chloroflexota bacterium]
MRHVFLVVEEKRVNGGVVRSPIEVHETFRDSNRVARELSEQHSRHMAEKGEPRVKVWFVQRVPYFRKGEEA